MKQNETAEDVARASGLVEGSSSSSSSRPNPSPVAEPSTLGILPRALGSRKRGSEDRGANPKGRDMEGGNDSIPSTVRPVVASGSRKRGSGDQGDQDEDRNRTRNAPPSTMVSVSRTRGTVALTTSSTDPAVEQMDEGPMSLERGRAEKW